MLFRPRNLTKHCAAILDLDGTIADNNHRKHLLPHKDLWTISSKEANLAWQMFHKDLHKDTFSKYVYDIYQYYCGMFPTIRRVIVSGRSESNRPNIIRWLNANNIDVDEMYLRSDGDYSSNAELKVKFVEQLRQENINSLFAFEDELGTCLALKEAKVQVYKVTLPNTIERF